MQNQVGTPTDNPLNTPLYMSDTPQDFHIKSNATENGKVVTTDSKSINSVIEEDLQKVEHVNVFKVQAAERVPISINKSHNLDNLNRTGNLSHSLMNSHSLFKETGHFAGGQPAITPQ